MDKAEEKLEKGKKLTVLVIGSGGREHVLVWKLKQSGLMEKTYCIPGNGGISQETETFNIPLEFKVVGDFIAEKGVDLILVGPEVPLVNGMADYFRNKGIMVFGPGKEAARLEGSKIFSKTFMKKHGIPTAQFEAFNDTAKAMDYLNGKKEAVIKADGLCAGKGVVVSESISESRDTVNRFMKERIFGEAGAKIVIEERLKGEEVSILVLMSGENYSVMVPSQDHKPVFDDDKGPNTGGMGAYAPASLINSEVAEKIRKKIIEPVIGGLIKEGINYSGVLYLGLMMCNKEPYVLEFNVRFGDPESQVVFPLLEDDLLEVILKLERGEKIMLNWKTGSCVDVVIASGGYPGEYPKGRLITFSGKLPEGVNIFHAGTEYRDGNYYTAGGRVLNVCAIGEDIFQARNKAYDAIKSIHFEEMHFRRDIGMKEIKRLQI